jgi:hypothetical protein
MAVQFSVCYIDKPAVELSFWKTEEKIIPPCRDANLFPRRMACYQSATINLKSEIGRGDLSQLAVIERSLRK